MHLNANLLVALLGLGLVLAHPRHHMHQKRVDYSNPSLYKDIDWTKVDYTGGKKAAPQYQAPAPEASPPEQNKKVEPNPKKERPVVQQKQAQPKDTSATDDTRTAPSTSNAGAKRGLTVNPESPDLTPWAQFSKISWCHNWASDQGKCSAKYDYVPTLHGLGSDKLQSWDANVKKAASGGKTLYLQSFNEPDIVEGAGGSNIDIGVAVEGYKKHVAPHAGGNVKLGSPSVSNGVGTNAATGRPYGLGWLKPFLEQCNGCPIDFVPVHWYGCDACPVDEDIALFKKQIGDAIALAGGKPVWIPEFAPKLNHVQFLEKALPWLDGNDAVERYAYFWVKDGIMTSGGQPNELGRTFASA